MPWKTSGVMEERVRFAVEYESGEWITPTSIRAKSVTYLPGLNCHLSPGSHNKSALFLHFSQAVKSSPVTKSPCSCIFHKP